MARKNDFTQNETSLFPGDKGTEIINYLKGLPHLFFSEKGLLNVSKRFSISNDQLEQYIKTVTDEQKETR